MAENSSTRYVGTEAWLFPDRARATDTLRTVAINRLHDGQYCVVDGVYSTTLDNGAAKIAYAHMGYRSVDADRLLTAVKAGKVSSHGRAPFGRQGVQPAVAIDLTPEHAREFGVEMSEYTDLDGNAHTGFIVLSVWAYMQLMHPRTTLGPSAENHGSALTYASLAEWLPLLRAEDEACFIAPNPANPNLVIFGMPRIAGTARDERNAERIAGSIYEQSAVVTVAAPAAPAANAVPLMQRARTGFTRGGFRGQ
jgi:hypothetical protein